MRKPAEHQVAVAAAEQVRNAIATLRESRDALHAERASLAAAIETIQSAPLSNADAKQFMLDLIDKGAKRFIHEARWPEIFKRVAFPATEQEHDGRLVASQLGKKDGPPHAPLSLDFVEKAMAGDDYVCGAMLGFVDRKLFMGLDERKPFQWTPRLFFFFGDQIKAKVSEHFDALYPQYGRGPNPTDTMVERSETIAAHRNRIIAIEAELQDVNGQLAELGCPV